MKKIIGWSLKQYSHTNVRDGDYMPVGASMVEREWALKKAEGFRPAFITGLLPSFFQVKPYFIVFYLY